MTVNIPCRPLTPVVFLVLGQFPLNLHTKKVRLLAGDLSTAQVACAPDGEIVAFGADLSGILWPPKICLNKLR